MQSLRADAVVDFYETGDPEALRDFAQRDIEPCEKAGLVWVCHGWAWLALAESCGVTGRRPSATLRRRTPSHPRAR